MTVGQPKNHEGRNGYFSSLAVFVFYDQVAWTIEEVGLIQRRSVNGLNFRQVHASNCVSPEKFRNELKKTHKYRKHSDPALHQTISALLYFQKDKLDYSKVGII